MTRPWARLFDEVEEGLGGVLVDLELSKDFVCGTMRREAYARKRFRSAFDAYYV
jgi:hypothetical protein